jgi:hypothetical protein
MHAHDLKEVPMNATLTNISLISAVFAASGSLMFVNRKDRHGVVHEAQYELGAMSFLIGNAATIALALHIGDLVLLSSQLGLVYFTIPMYREHKHAKAFSLGCVAWFVALVMFLGISNEFHFTASYIGAGASVIAIYGAWLMSKFRFTGMAWCWLVADLIFIAVAILNHLPILGVLACVFVLHSIMRLRGYTRVGLFSFEK